MFEPTGNVQGISTYDVADQVRGHGPDPVRTSRREQPAAHRDGRHAPPSSRTEIELPATAGEFVTAGQLGTAVSDDPRSSGALPGTDVTPVPASRHDEWAPSSPVRSGDVAAPPTRIGHVAERDLAMLRTAPAEASPSVDATTGRDQGPTGAPVVIPHLTPAQSSSLDDGMSSGQTVSAGEASQRLAPAVPAAAGPQALPRLHAVPAPEPAAGKPEITVTIGRIEVLQPAPEPPAPRPTPPVKGATAPDLAQYLRERSGR